MKRAERERRLRQEEEEGGRDGLACGGRPDSPCTPSSLVVGF